MTQPPGCLHPLHGSHLTAIKVPHTRSCVGIGHSQRESSPLYHGEVPTHTWVEDKQDVSLTKQHKNTRFQTPVSAQELYDIQCSRIPSSTAKNTRWSYPREEGAGVGSCPPEILRYIKKTLLQKIVTNMFFFKILHPLPLGF